MNIDATAVIEKYKSMLTEQQYLTVLVELQVKQLQTENAQLRDALNAALAKAEEETEVEAELVEED